MPRKQSDAQRDSPVLCVSFRGTFTVFLLICRNCPSIESEKSRMPLRKKCQQAGKNGNFVPWKRRGRFETASSYVVIRVDLTVLQSRLQNDLPRTLMPTELTVGLVVPTQIRRLVIGRSRLTARCNGREAPQAILISLKKIPTSTCTSWH